MKYAGPIPFAFLLALAGAWTAEAQVPDTLRSDQEGVLLRGRITDLTTQRGIPNVAVRVLDLNADGRMAWEGMSDSTGIFHGPRLPPSMYGIEAEALGYSSLWHAIDVSGYGVADLGIELGPDALELEPLLVVTRRRSRLEMAGFYQRRNRGFGHSLTREEIEARQPSFVSDLVRTMPGVTVAPGVMGGGGVLRMRGGCQPDVILDGVRLSPPVMLDNLLTVNDLEGIEVYSGSTSPVEYSHSSCGTVLAWTRDPGGGGGSPWSWKRAGAAAGFLLLGFLLTG
jgi:hypothetical protein